MRTHLKSPRTDGSKDPVDNQAEMTSRWVVRQCPYCDERGYLPNGFRCHHEPPEAAAERARRGANLARAALRVTDRPARDEPYLPPDLAAETAARLETETEQPEQEPA